MKKVSKIGAVVIVGTMVFVRSVFASGLDLLVNTLAEKGIISYGEAQQLSVDIKEEIKKQIAKGELDTIPRWVQNLSLRGDIRLRYQTDWAAGAAEDRKRARLRLRLGAETRLVENVKAGFGLATGVSYGTTNPTLHIPSTGTYTIPVSVDIVDKEPRSTNYTFGDSLSKGLFFVDYGFIEYSPFEWFKATLGKFRNPIWQTTDIIWDTDLNHEGIALNFDYKFTPDLGIFLVPEMMIIDERSTGVDPIMYAVQPGVNWGINEDIKLKLGVAYYVFNGVKGNTLDHSANTNARSGGRYTMEYNTLNPSLSLDVKGVPFVETTSVFGDYVLNSSTDTNNVGYCAGIRVGASRINEFGQWSLRYLYRYLERDAFVDVFPDSDSYGGRTNSFGSEIIFEMGLTKNTLLSIDYYTTDVIKGQTNTTPRSLIQVDFVTRF
ncbi:MAG: putative porin [Bacteroidales bacterium]